MKLEVYFSPAQLDELQLRDKNVAVIDVLRSSTTVVTALHNGAREIIPVSTVESAVKVSGNLFGDVVLRGGERNGKIIDGFNLGNSPTEYTEEAVKAKSIIFCTTNGSGTMVKARYAKRMIVTGFVNMSTVVDYIREIGEDFLIICAGRQQSFSLEDAVCAGMIVKQMTEDEKLPLDLNDAAAAAQSLFRSTGKNLQKMARNSDHGRYLAEIGFENDIHLCTEVDSVPALPVLAGNVIKLRKDAAKGAAPELKEE